MKNTISLLVWLLLITTAANAQTVKTVGSGGDYSTLKTAFDDVNSGILTGAITFQISSSIADNNSAILNASGSGSANYTSVLIYPSGSGFTLSGNISNALINLNGADNITIDGRVNATGATKDLVVTNSNTGSSSSTIRLSNSAESNTVKYCTLKGSATNSGSGIIVFSSSTAGNGNDGNTITNNDITSDAAGRPYNVIYTSGTSGRENSGNNIVNNNIYNFLSSAASSRGINIGSNSIDWTISGNSFYETTTIVPAAANSYNIIYTGTSSSHLISGNYIGGSAPQCGGAAFTINSSYGHFFYVISISGGTTTPVTVQNNIIQNINYTSTNSNPWDGIYIAPGNLNVTITGNTIGAVSGNGSIVINTPNAAASATISGGVLTGINLAGGGSGFATAPLITFSTSGSNSAATATAIISGGIVTGFNITNGGTGYTTAPTVYFNAANYSTSHGIRDLSTGTVFISGNNIGSITSAGNDTYSHCFESIVISGAPAAITISNNLIGSLTSANSIQTSSAAASSLVKQDTRGIYINAIIPLSTISGNTIANLTSAYSGNVFSKLDGISILSYGGSNVIQNNTIRNLSAIASSITVKGIESLTNTSGTSQTVTGNTVYNLSSTHAAASIMVKGIDFASPTSGTNTVSGNFVYGLSVTSANTNSEIDGISLGNGVATTSNNIINLGGNINSGYKIFGIYDNSSVSASNNNYVYFNSVYIGGAVLSGATSSTAALWNANNTSVRNYRNNILTNARTGGTGGKHYAIRVAGTNGLTINYNDYYVSGSGILGNISGTDKNTLALWKTATAQDVNSLNTDPLYTNAGGTDPLNYNSAAALQAVSGTGIVKDYHGITRSITPKMGALENNNFVWLGTISNDFGTAGNWSGGVVPTTDADIFFDANPVNDCVLDQNRTLDDITNAQGTYKLITNGKQLNITGTLYFSNGAQINATAASSEVIFSGTAAQSIPATAFVSNSINALTVNNAISLTLNNHLTVEETLTLSSGTLIIGSNTLTLNGAVSKIAGSLTGGSSSNIYFNGTTATELPAVTLNELAINRSGGISLGGTVTVEGILTLTQGTLTLGPNSLIISGASPVRTNGDLDASHAAATLVFSNTAAITLPSNLFSASINNLTINGAGGVTAVSDLTVNGILNLTAANPASTRGLLEMTADYYNYPGTANSDYLNSYILYMGAAATTTGTGDVTGTIKRSTIIENTAYTFGHQFTTLALSSGTMPDAIAVTVTIGTTPSGNPDAIKRTYEIIPTVPGGYTSAAHVTANFHYLDNERTSSISPYHVNTESIMVTMDYDIGGGFGVPDEHGRSAYDFNNKFIGLSNIPISYFINIPGHAWRTIFQLRDYLTGYYTWDGSTSSDWGTSTNWTPTGVPSDMSHVIIPDAATTPNDPVLPAGITINTLTIQNGGILIMGNETLTIKNSLSGGWEDQNILGNDPGTSTVIFSMPGTTISGNARFYNVEIADGADITNQTGSTMKIANTITKTGSGTGKWYADLYGSTIEYNGGNQSVLPTDAVPYYHKLILSGSGTKALPASLMSLHGDMVFSGGVTATAVDSITVNGNLIIENGATFNTGNYNHAVKGNIDNSGTLNTAAGYTIFMNGGSAQSILGSSNTVFENLTVNNSNGVGVYTNSSINNILTLANGNLTVGEATLAINGTLNKTDGLIDVSTLSSLSFNGTSAITLSGNLFTNTPSINNLTVNNTAGVTMDADLAANNIVIAAGTLQIQSGKSLTCVTDFNNGVSGVFINNGSLILKGNITNDQPSMAVGTGTLSLSGTTEQTVSGTQTLYANNLINDNSAGIILNNNLSVSGIHTFTNGIITTSAAPRYVIYESGASYNGDGDGSHINGWVKRKGNTDFIFPVGNGTYERVISVTDMATTSEFNVKYNGAVTPNNNQLNSPLVRVNPFEYWSINKISGTSAKVVINWDNSKIAFPQFTLNDIRAAYYDGLFWNDIGGSATGDVTTTGSITSASISGFDNNFAIGSTSFALPVHIISFTASKVNDYNTIGWTIADEQAVKNYELERSDDGIHFYTINSQFAQNLNNEVLYSYNDKILLSGNMYYRLKIIKNNSQVIYSHIVRVSVTTNNKEFYVITNPVDQSIDIYAGAAVAGLYRYTIASVGGQIMQSGMLDIKYRGVYSIKLQSMLAGGAYILIVQNGTNMLQRMILKK